jgi:hypothetical protein
LKASGTFLDLANERSHITPDKYAIKGLPHPPYSPDLAICDLSPFGHLKHCPEGQFFDDDIALQGAVSKIQMSREPDMFVVVFAEWKRRLQ